MWKVKPDDYISAQQNTQRIAAELWADLRAKRDQLLRDSDWTQVSDAPVDQAAWAAYRGLLRDLPETTVNVMYPVWPTPPSVGVAA